MKELFYALRFRQWTKNLFIFLPLVFGKKLFVFPANLNTMIAFALFCFSSSAVYLINDILDLREDRLHPTKRLRPLAAGKMSLGQAKLTACILGIGSIVFSLIFNFEFGLIVIAYFCLNFLYSKIFRNLVIIDVFCLAGFFLLRIMIGGVMAEVRLSHWIIFMTTFLALFLGFNKRRQELRLIQKEAYHHRKVLTKYSLHFIDQISTVITASIVTTYMLYTVDAGTVALFKTKNLIYSAPFVYYGIFRYLYLSNKIIDDGDPAHILFSDRATQLNLALWIISCIFIIYL